MVVIVPSFADGDGILFDVEIDGDVIDQEPVSVPFLVPKWNFVAHDQYEDLSELTDAKIELCYRQKIQ